MGCIPAKALLRNAELAHIFTREAKTFGIRVDGQVSSDYGEAYGRSRKVADGRVKGVHYLMKKNKITEIDGRGYIELSILPVAVSWGCGLDGSLPRFPLTAAELTELGHQLYELLAQFHGYVAAKVGWDPESLLDPAELRGEWSDELNDGSIHGLVLCEKLHAELDPSTDYEVFQPGYRWIPYRGEGPSSLTAD